MKTSRSGRDIAFRVELSGGDRGSSAGAPYPRCGEAQRRQYRHQGKLNGNNIAIRAGKGESGILAKITVRTPGRDDSKRSWNLLMPSTVGATSFSTSFIIMKG